ncbi:hypothetical protein [Limnoglobus roseus]|uniref:Uncharacterized protein n=1 Tax=Limnoglobus roseus TaxID=2598579 RepID=A0A5C1AH65_9BACT|nr:hypothetical protein [Limnoglobus roseus]QEL18561.1 hypothetical protein PX52LOC_05593 [Limnoglobus roseus]
MTVTAFNESVFGRPREQVERRYGPPARSMRADFVGRDAGSFYEGEFTTDGGAKVQEVRLYYMEGVVVVG